jgi:hypothetical protein
MNLSRFSIALLAVSDLLHAAAVRIALDPATVLTPIANDFIGFGYETSAVARTDFLSAQNLQMVQLYRTLSLHGLVRIGGIIGDHTRYEPEGRPVAQTMKGTTVINQAVLADLGGFLRATGWKALWTFNLGTGTKSEAGLEAVAVSAALGDRLDSFEIGNEVDNLKRFKNYAEYHAAYLDYKAAIRAVLPAAVFAGPDTTGRPNDWVVKFAQTEANDLKLLITHYYCAGAKSPAATVETMLASDYRLDSRLQTLRATGAARNLAFRINEVNSFSGGGKPEVSDTFASALWVLDFMYRVAVHGGAGVNLETDVNQLGFISHYSPIFRNEDGGLTARPEYYGMLAFALAGQGSLIKISASKLSINLTAYATKNSDGIIWVTIINKDLARAANAALAMPAGCTTAEAYRLTALSPQSKGDVTLAGAQITSQGAYTPGATEQIPVVRGTAKFTLPAASAVVVRLS